MAFTLNGILARGNPAAGVSSVWACVVMSVPFGSPQILPNPAGPGTPDLLHVTLLCPRVPLPPTPIPSPKPACSTQSLSPGPALSSDLL